MSLHLAVVVHRSPAEVYAVAAAPENLPRWAAGLSTGDVRREGDAWVTDSPMGRVSVVFTPQNDLGVLDHVVTLPDGSATLNPLRVLPHPEGAEVVFTLRADPDSEDAAVVRADLQRLKALLEG